MGILFQYLIMACVLGFTGNKIFNKKDNSTRNSIKWGCIVGSIASIVHLFIIFF